MTDTTTEATKKRLAVLTSDGGHTLDADAFSAAAIAAGFVSNRSGLAIAAIATETGVHRTLIYRHRKGDHAPSIDSLVRYADAFKCSPLDLVKPSEAVAAKLKLERLMAAMEAN